MVAPDQLFEGDLIPDPQAGDQAAWSITTPGVAIRNGFVTPSLLARPGKVVLLTTTEDL